MAAAIIHSDFGIREDEACHYFHIFPFCLRGSKALCLHTIQKYSLFCFCLGNVLPFLPFREMTLVFMKKKKKLTNLHLNFNDA